MMRRIDASERIAFAPGLAIGGADIDGPLRARA